MMNWDAISTVAEVIGAGAVLITLVYLAVQTRDDVKVQRARAVWDAQLSFVEINDMLADGGTVSELVFRSLSDPDSLSSKDRYLLHRFARGWFQRMEAQHALYRAGILEPEVWQLRLGYSRALLDSTIFHEFWEKDKKNSMFTEQFIAAIDGATVTEYSGFIGVADRAEK